MHIKKGRADGLSVWIGQTSNLYGIFAERSSQDALTYSPKPDLTQLFAVKFLMALCGSSTLGPLKRAFAQDQGEVTRAAALDGLFAVSQVEAKPYVKAALGECHNSHGEGPTTCGVCINSKTNDRPTIDRRVGSTTAD
jgi:hypothetical protein